MANFKIKTEFLREDEYYVCNDGRLPLHKVSFLKYEIEIYHQEFL